MDLQMEVNEELQRVLFDSLDTEGIEGIAASLLAAFNEASEYDPGLPLNWYVEQMVESLTRLHKRIK